MSRQVSLRNEAHDQVKAMIALARGGHHSEARAWAVNRWGEAGAPVELRKAAGAVTAEGVSGGMTLSDAALFAAVREQAVLFRLRGARRTGFNIRSVTATGSTATWLAEGAAMPLSSAVFDAQGLDIHKVAGGTVATNESLDLGPSVEAAIFADLTAALVDALDLALLDPANAGDDGAPAAITYGATAVTATDSIAVDLAALVAAFEGDLRAAYFAMSPATAAKLSAIGDGSGTANGRYPDVGVRGGDLMGAPVLVARNAPTDSVALIDPTGLQIAHDDAVLLSSTEAGTFEVADPPVGDSVTPTPTQTVSMFQTDTRGFKGLFFASWRVARPGSVAVLQGGGTDWLA